MLLRALPPSSCRSSRLLTNVLGGLAATLIAGSACGDDPAAQSDPDGSDTAGDVAPDTSSDVTGDTTFDDAGPDATSDAPEDTTPPGDTSPSDAGDAQETADVADSADAADAPDLADVPDLADATTSPSTRFALVAWTGASNNSPSFGGITSHAVLGSTFEPSQSLLGGTAAMPIRSGDAANLAADVDGDGLADLVAWTGFSNNSPARGSISVYLANGSGYEDATTWFAGSDAAPAQRGDTANAAGDVDGDGDMDLVAWSGLSDSGPFRGVVNVHLATGANFAAASSWLSGTAPAPVLRGSTANLVGDVDGDGKADLVAWSGFAGNGPFRGSVQVHLSTGSAFAPASSWLTGSDPAPVQRGSAANLLADVDGDGRADLVAISALDPAGPFRGTIQVHLSTGSGFAPATAWRVGSNEVPVPAGGAATLVTDVNADGKADVVAWSGARQGSWGAIQVQLSNGSGFDAPATWLAGSPQQPVAGGATANLGGLVFSDE